jgi:hypothetical protein
VRRAFRFAPITSDIADEFARERLEFHGYAVCIAEQQLQFRRIQLQLIRLHHDMSKAFEFIQRQSEFYREKRRANPRDIQAQTL